MRRERVINIFSLCQKGGSIMQRMLFAVILSLFLMVCMTSPTWAGGDDDADAGAYALDAGDYDEAIRLFTKAIESGDLHPVTLYAVYNFRGKAWDHKGDYDRAISDFTKAIESGPSISIAYYNRGNVWGRKGDYEDRKSTRL